MGRAVNDDGGNICKFEIAVKNVFYVNDRFNSMIAFFRYKRTLIYWCVNVSNQRSRWERKTNCINAIFRLQEKTLVC